MLKKIVEDIMFLLGYPSYPIEDMKNDRAKNLEGPVPSRKMVI